MTNVDLIKRIHTVQSRTGLAIRITFADPDAHGLMLMRMWIDNEDPFLEFVRNFDDAWKEALRFCDEVCVERMERYRCARREVQRLRKKGKDPKHATKEKHA
jgi:hypothetical protein